MFPSRGEREKALLKIEESHQRFLDSEMFKRFCAAYDAEGKTDSVAEEFKRQGVLVSAAIHESRKT